MLIGGIARNVGVRVERCCLKTRAIPSGHAIALPSLRHGYGSWTLGGGELERWQEKKTGGRISYRCVWYLFDVGSCVGTGCYRYMGWDQYNTCKLYVWSPSMQIIRKIQTSCGRRQRSCALGGVACSWHCGDIPRGWRLAACAR
jgi:hypothetical protein